MRRAFAAVIAACAAVCGAAALAQPYPDRPIKIIVPTPAGGPVDVMARLIANALPSRVGQPVYIENKPGAGNIIGSKLAADAPPDGYTLIVTSASGLVISPIIHKSAGYTAASFTPISLIAGTPQVLVINAKLPFKSVAELVAYAKANPGKLNYSTGGIGTLPHLTAELFKSEAGINIVHVPYKGGGPALQAVMTGQVQMLFDTVSTSLQLVRNGKLRALAIGSSSRVAELPNVPTMREAGFPQLSTGAWTALLGPHGLPPAVVAKLNAAVNTALRSSALTGTLAKLGAKPRGGTPKELADYVASETAKWKPIVRSLNLID